MKKLLAGATAIGVIVAATVAYAQDEKMYLSKSGDKQMVMGGANAEGTELLIGENAAKPGDCPAGHFYTTDPSQQMVMACDDDAQFSLAVPESGSMMANGQPYPEGSMIMTPSQ